MPVVKSHCAGLDVHDQRLVKSLGLVNKQRKSKSLTQQGF